MGPAWHSKSFRGGGEFRKVQRSISHIPPLASCIFEFQNLIFDLYYLRRCQFYVNKWNILEYNTAKINTPVKWFRNSTGTQETCWILSYDITRPDNLYRYLLLIYDILRKLNDGTPYRYQNDLANLSIAPLVNHVRVPLSNPVSVLAQEIWPDLVQEKLHIQHKKFCQWWKNLF